MTRQHVGSTPENTATLILAGGDGRRMGSLNKLDAPLNKISLLEHAIRRVKKQTQTLFLSVHTTQRPNCFGQACIEDHFEPKIGPIGGLYSAMHYTKKHLPEIKWLMISPADCPFLPLDLHAQLAFTQKRTNALACYAHYAEQSHYLCSLWSLTCYESVKQHIDTKNYALHKLLKTCHAVKHVFKKANYDPFLNINTLEDLHEAERIQDTWHRNCNND